MTCVRCGIRSNSAANFEPENRLVAQGRLPGGRRIDFVNLHEAHVGRVAAALMSPDIWRAWLISGQRSGKRRPVRMPWTASGT